MIDLSAYRQFLEAKRPVAASLGFDVDPAYFRDGVAYLQAAERELAVPTLFDLLEPGAVDEAHAGVAAE